MSWEFSCDNGEITQQNLNENINNLGLNGFSPTKIVVFSDQKGPGEV
jgi:hypothetical protein